MEVLLWTRASSSGMTTCTCVSSPPTANVASRRPMPSARAKTGAPTKPPPACVWSRASSRHVSGWTVEQDRWTQPRGAVDSTPSLPRVTSRRIASLGTNVTTAAAATAAAAGDSAILQPSSAAAARASWLRSKTISSCPAARRLLAVGMPIAPSPI
eukprot:scaffold15104_cov31-Tisochrysis_lutea.AAC.1